MELTLEQTSAVERGEAITVQVPHVNGECVILLRDHYIDMQERLQEEADLETAWVKLAKTLTPDRLRNFAKNHQPDPSWYEEDHTGLYDLSSNK